MKKLGSIAVCLALVLGMGALGGCGISKSDESVRLTAHYAFDEGSGGVTREQVSGKDKKIAYVFSVENQANLYKEANDPLWRQGVSGKSLYMDGYSTYVQDDAFPNIKGDFTVSAFVAPRAFELAEGSDFDLTAIAGKGDVTIEEGFLLGYGYLGDVAFVLNLYDPADDIMVKTVRITAPAARLKLYAWNHVAASYSVADARVTLYLNGAPVYQTVLSECAGWKVQPSNEPFAVGQFVAAASAGSYKRNTVAGLLDEVRMYDGELPATDVAALYAAVSDNLALPYSEVALDASVFATDRYRPQYHAMPDGLWMNEPHAPIYYKGKYHLFFQHNAVGTYFAQIQWGHLVSDDMVSWKQVKNAVVRTEGVADKGIWTGGSVIGPDGAPWLAVTAGVTQANGSGQNIAFAHPADPNDPELTDWVLEKAVTVPQTEGTTDQFRDPFVWCDGGVYYMIVGTTANMTGGALHMYTSTDMRNWVRRGYLYTASKEAYPQLSDRWECSILLPVHNDAGKVKYALMVLPQNPEPNYTELYYWLGDFDKNAYRFVPDDPAPRLLDYGRNIYNGQTGFCYRTEADVAAGKTYEQGRTVLFALAQGRELPDKGWMHNVAIPLELRLSDDGKELRYAPIAELANLHGNVLAEKEESVSVQEINERLENVHTDCAKIQFTVTVENEQEGFVAGLDVRADTTRTDGEYTRIKLFEDEWEGRAMAVERTATSKLSLSLMDTLSRGVGAQKTFAVTVYLDRSMLEVYVNDTFSFTTRVYPTRSTADGLRFVAENCDVTVSGVKVTAMKTMQGTTPVPAYYGNVQ